MAAMGLLPPGGAAMPMPPGYGMMPPHAHAAYQQQQAARYQAHLDASQGMRPLGGMPPPGARPAAPCGAFA